ncbi:MAG: aminoacyl-tRNA hydrolase [Clostridiales Family XIII bacterium]|jgi:PTH1 family peptidyl-tRNA hydrolase|nr:aminoacyl-tRNA hydrolase [Clostridiales Family XIII bacterium]
MDYIIVGLGNPGRRYENTKHNMGFLALDLLAERNGIRISRLRHRALCGEGAVAGRRVFLVKPQTYMNLSGESVRAVMEYYKAPHDGLLVICDDIDIPIGDIRIRAKGSAGSHNGMRSIVDSLGYADFPRIRIGIGDGERPRGDSLVGYVLGGFQKQRVSAVEDAIGRAADAAECLLREGAEAAMNRYNARAAGKGEKRDGGAKAEAKKSGADEER